MPLKIAYLLVRWLYGLVVLMLRGDRAKNAELLVLRHENAVLRLEARRVRDEPADRAWFAALAPFIPRRQWARVFPVTPATLLAWHRRLAARTSRQAQAPGTVPRPAKRRTRYRGELTGTTERKNAMAAGGAAIPATSTCPYRRP